MTVLVAYASRHGATEGIATRIAERIADVGTAVDLRQVDAVGSLDAYDAMVFGAPVYDQSWPPEADRFVDQHRDVLAALPVWLFSVGSFGDTKRLIGPLTHKEPKRIAEVRSAMRPPPRLAGDRGVGRPDRAHARAQLTATSSGAARSPSEGIGSRPASVPLEAVRRPCLVRPVVGRW